MERFEQYNRDETNLQRMPNNLWRYLPLRAGCESKLSTVWLWAIPITFFQRVWKGGGGEGNMLENLKVLSQSIDPVQHQQYIMLILCTLDVMWWEGPFTPMVFLLQTHNPSLTKRRASDKPKWNGLSPNTWPVPRKTKVLERNKDWETEQSRGHQDLTGMWSVGWAPRTDEGH